MHATDSALFISDLHLSPERIAATAAFEDFLSREAQVASDLFILGDLFDVWVGDDQRDVFTDRIVTAMRGLVETGTRLWLMGGNRDFMIGQDFADAVGAELLTDPSVIALGEERVLLCHGDTLCDRAHAYLRWRRWSRNPGLRALFSHLPRHWRDRIGASLRARSVKNSQRRGYRETGISDDDRNIVSQQIVSELLREHGAEHMVHGHTHRPAVHRLEPGGGRRVVLGAWDTARPIRYLRYADGNWQLERATQLL